MNQRIGDRLRTMMETYGLGLCGDPKRTEGLLRDFFPESSREITLIVTVVRLGIAEEMSKLKGAEASLRSANWVGRIHGEAGIDMEYARWAIETWLCAFGITNAVILPPSVDTRPAVPTHSHRPLDKTTADGTISGNTPQQYYEVGLRQGRAGDRFKAVELLEQAVCMSPENAKFQYALGVAYHNIECHSQARECLARAVQLDPRYADIPDVARFLEQRNKHLGGE